jgi:hypothetical protein
MPKSEKTPPRLTPESERAAAIRQERLAAALRANLGRRKAQSRDRATASEAKKTRAQ